MGAQKLVDYTFAQTDVSNPDGSLAMSVQNATVVGGPGAIGSDTYPQAVDLATSGRGSVDVATIAVDLQRFAVRVVFAANAQVTGRQNVVESTFLPFSMYLAPRDATGFDLVTAVAPKAHGWRDTSTRFSTAIAAGTWHVADLVYDIDTLAVFVDGKIVSVHAFPNGLIEKGTGTQLFVGTWIDGVQYHFNGKIAAVQWYAGIPDELETQLDERRSTAEWYITHKVETLRPTFDPGVPTGAVAYDSAIDAYSQPYTGCDLMYHDGLGCAFEMHGAIRALYHTIADRSALGYLVSDERNSSNHAGRKSAFSRGAIYWSAATGAVPILDQIYLDYEAMGETTAIGFPTKPAVAISGGFEQEFQVARMYYRAGTTNAHEVHGAILGKYLALGGPGTFGFPVSNETDVKKDGNTIGRFSEFEGCTIWWSAASGAFETHGDIRTKYRDAAGPAGELGFPTSDEMNIPGAAGRMNTFQRGSILWYGSWSSIVVARPFTLYVGRIDTKEDEGWGMGENDIYLNLKVTDGGNVVFSKRHPSSGDLGDHNVVDIQMNLPPTITPNAAKDVVLSVDVWDSDPIGDDHLGTWNKVLNAANGWGLTENGGILNSGGFSNINNIQASVKPIVDVRTLSEPQKFWGVRNKGTDDIAWSDYAAAFRDVDSETEWWDVTDWLEKAFYAAAVKDLAENGNCFGMSLEAIYARKGASPFSLPLDRFTNWDTVRSMFNTKHAYQVGAGPIWWFLGQFISGNTHDPKDVFRSTRSEFTRGNNPVLCIAQNYDFSGAPHCILPVGWDDSAKPWRMTILDPNFPGQVRTLTVNPDDNTFAYQGASSYSGGQWSGGRMHYMPWQLLCERERTPVWDAILLLLAGTIIIMGSDTRTASLTDPDGNDIDGFGQRAIADLQARRTLNDYFVPFNAYNRIRDRIVDRVTDEHVRVTDVTRARGKGAVSGEILTRMHRSRNREAVVGRAGVDLSVIAHRVVGELRANRDLRSISDAVTSTAALSDRTLHHIAADDGVMSRLPADVRDRITTLLGSARPGDYRHEVVGDRDGEFLYAAKHGLGQFKLESSVAQGERTQIGVTDIATSKQNVRVVADRDKRMKLTVENKLGVAQDRIRITIDQIPVASGKELHLNVRPGLGDLEVLPATAGATAPVEVETVIGGRLTRRRFDLPLDQGARIKLSNAAGQDVLGITRIDKLFGPGRDAIVLPAKP